MKRTKGKTKRPKNKKMRDMLSAILIVIATSVIISITTMASDLGVDIGDHNIIVIQTDLPTCRENGSQTLRCVDCDRVFVVTLYALGCDWGPWVIEREATCTRTGLFRSVCRVDRAHSQTEVIPVTRHNFVREVEEATCTEPGREVYACSECGYEERENPIEATGHQYIRATTQEPSCVSAGEVTITCENCYYSRVESYAEPMGHYFNENITRVAVCGHDGELTFTCERCDYSYTEPIPMLSHSWGAFIVATPPEEGVAGVGYRTCNYCGARAEEEIPALAIPEEEERGLIGVEEVVVIGANAIAWIVLFYLLLGEIAFLLWRRRKKRSVIERMKLVEGGDGYELI
jgi:cbb3-type cytochrome oxidase subunit 3